jgi:hypothetical protein
MDEAMRARLDTDYQYHAPKGDQDAHSAPADPFRLLT